VETIIGAPLLWLLAVLLRTWLHDGTGMLSYVLLLPVAVAIHAMPPTDN